MEQFSQRNKLDSSADKEITKRYEASAELRSIVVEAAYSAGLQSGEIRQVLCDLLLKRPDENNWSRSNVMTENLSLIDSCDWYHVYDFVEIVDDILRDKRPDPDAAGLFEGKLNRYFRREGIGWELKERQIVFRGNDEFQETLGK